MSGSQCVALRQQPQQLQHHWKLIRNADYWASPLSTESEILGVGPAIYVFTNLLGDLDAVKLKPLN